MKYIIRLFIILIINLSVPNFLSADVLTTTIAAGGKITASVIADKTVSNLIQDARNQAQGLIVEGERSGNVLLIRGADQLNLATDNLIRQLAEHLNKTFNKLDQTSKNMLLGLANATQNASELADKAYTFKDTLTLDTRSILGELPFVTETLVLQRVTGLSSIVGKDEYELDLIGSYIGLPGANHRTSISVNIDGKNIKKIRNEPTQVHVTKIIIPADAVIKNEPINEPLRIPITFNIEQSFEKPFLGFLWNTTEKKSYSSTVTLTIYPRYAGELEVIARHLQYGWKKDIPIQRPMTHEAHCKDNCKNWYGRVYSVSIDLEGNKSSQKVGDKRIIDQSCKWKSGTRGYSVFVSSDVTSDKSKATCTIRFRTRPQTYILTAQTEKYQVISEDDKVIKMPIYYGKTTEVKVPKSTQMIILKSKLITGEDIDLIDTEVDALSPVQIIKIIDNFNDKSIFINVDDPSV